MPSSSSNNNSNNNNGRRDLHDDFDDTLLPAAAGAGPGPGPGASSTTSWSEEGRGGGGGGGKQDGPPTEEVNVDITGDVSSVAATTVSGLSSLPWSQQQQQQQYDNEDDPKLSSSSQFLSSPMKKRISSSGRRLGIGKRIGGVDADEAPALASTYDDDMSMMADAVVSPRMPSTSSRVSSQQVLEELSINKLNFHKVHLQGRQDETSKLQGLWNDMWISYSARKREKLAFKVGYSSSNRSSTTTTKKNSKNKKILAVVDGLSGVGKSKLVTDVLKKTVQSSRYHSFFVSGKFDLNNSQNNNNAAVPFDGIRMAIEDLCDQIVHTRSCDNNDDHLEQQKEEQAEEEDTAAAAANKVNKAKAIRYDEIKQLLIDELSQELPFLIGIFPKLLDVVGGGEDGVFDDVVDDEDEDEDENVGNKSMNRNSRHQHQPPHDNKNDPNGGETTGMRPQTTSGTKKRKDVVVDVKANADRLKHCVRRFVQVICSYRPLVIFCDDTQWADDMSLDLLYQLLTDGNNHDALMVVCAYRTDEVFSRKDSRDSRDSADNENKNKNEREKIEGERVLLQVRSKDNNPMGTFLGKVKGLDDDLIATHYMTIGNLSADDLNAFLVDLLGSDSTASARKETYDLAVVIHEKTDGNIFFAVQVLKVLHEQGFIEYNLGLMKWIFNAKEIRENAPVAPNIVQFVKEKLSRDDDARQLLPIAACMGSVFDISMLSIVVSGLQRIVEVKSNVDEIESLEFNLRSDIDIVDNLERCCREGYIQRFQEGFSSTRYQFVHDRVQEAAFKTVPDRTQSWLKHQVGRILATDLPDDDLEDLVFTVLGLIDQDISSPSIEERQLYLKLNMLAGEKAMSYSAFKPAARYFKAAVELLPINSFELQYNLAFRAYLAAAEAEFCVGDFNAMSNFGEVVLSNEYVPAVDKLRITNVLMDALVAQNKARKSIDLALAGLARCGCKFPKNALRTGFAAATGLLKTKFSKRMQDPSSIVNLPFSTDPTQTVVMKTLDKLATAAFVAGESNLLPLVILKSLNWTFQYGITIYAPAAFALVALLVTNFMDDFGAGWNYARSALIMLKRLKCRDIESRTIFLVYNYTSHWSRPMKDCLKPFIKAYRIGLSSGDVMSAMYNVEFYCEVTLYTGMQLRLVDDNCIAYGEQMREFGQMNTLLAHRMVHQLVRLLMKGESTGRSLKLSGEIMDQDAVMKQLEIAGDELMQAALHRYRIILSCYLGDYEAGSQVASNHSDKAMKLLPGHPTNLMVRFCSALCCYAQYRTSSKRKLLREAKRQHQFVRRWSQRSSAHNPNAVHAEMLLSAELDAARGKSRSANTKYEAAILMAGRRGVIQDQALSNERFASYCREQNDVEEAQYRLKSAITLYTEWAGQPPARLASSSSDVPIIGSTLNVRRSPSGLSIDNSSSFTGF